MIGIGVGQFGKTVMRGYGGEIEVDCGVDAAGNYAVGYF
jgi:hypothetical protein